MSLFLPYVISSYVFSNLAKAVDGLGGSAVGVVFISEGIVEDGWCVMSPPPSRRSFHLAVIFLVGVYRP